MNTELMSNSIPVVYLRKAKNESISICCAFPPFPPNFRTANCIYITTCCCNRFSLFCHFGMNTMVSPSHCCSVLCQFGRVDSSLQPPKPLLIFTLQFTSWRAAIGDKGSTAWADSQLMKRDTVVQCARECADSRNGPTLGDNAASYAYIYSPLLQLGWKSYCHQGQDWLSQMSVLHSLV